MLYVLCAVFSLRLALAAESDLRPSNPSLETSAALAPARQGYRLFENVQLRSKTEIHFDPATRMVTIKMRINDPRGYFIPNLRPDNFLVYEDGVREDDTTVEVERLPVTLGVLLEYGGRFSVMNTALGQDISMAAIERAPPPPLAACSNQGSARGGQPGSSLPILRPPRHSAPQGVSPRLLWTSGG